MRAVGAVTNALCALNVGDTVGVRGPYGTAWPTDDAAGTDVVIVPGGIGLAPLRPAILEFLEQAEKFGSISLLYGARSPSDLLFKQDLLGWESSPSMNVEVTVDRATSDWWGDVGLVTNLISRVGFDPANTTALVCGPEVMMQVVARNLRDRGVSEDRIWVSMERNMKCGIGLCGHCQYGSDFLCRSGPVGSYARFAERLAWDEI